MAEIKYNINCDIERVSQTVAELGISIQEMSEAIQKITKTLAQTNWGNVENKTLKEEENDIRPATDIKTETPKQKSDLEIFSRIEENPFLPNFIDLDSEEFLHQRILGDFEANWHGK